jgi:hypothetical protein
LDDFNSQTDGLLELLPSGEYSPAESPILKGALPPGINNRQPVSEIVIRNEKNDHCELYIQEVIE